MKYALYALTMIILVIYSVIDVRCREVPAWLLYIGIAVVFAFQVVLHKNCAFRYIGVNVLVYAVIFIVSKFLERWIGGADFDVMYMIYLVIETRNIVLFMFAILAICGVVMLVRRSGRDKHLPLIPVLTAGYVITIIMGGGVY